MNTSQLEQFVAVADCGSMHKAADQLYITHQCLSVAIRNLEKELSSELFVRSKKGVVLNDAGKRVYSMAHDVLGVIEKTKAEVLPVESTPLVNVKVAAGINTALAPLLLVVQHFNQKRSDAAVSVNSMTPHYALERIADSRADFALVSLTDEQIDDLPNDVCIINAYRQHLFALMRSDHALAKSKSVSYEQLFKHPMVFFHQTFERFEEIGMNEMWGTSVQPNIVLETDDIGLHNSAIAAGKGFGLVSESLINFPAFADTLSSLGLVAVPLVRDFGLTLFSLCRCDITQEQFDLMVDLDSMMANELGLEKVTSYRSDEKILRLDSSDTVSFPRKRKK